MMFVITKARDPEGMTSKKSGLEIAFGPRDLPRGTRHVASARRRSGSANTMERRPSTRRQPVPAFTYKGQTIVATLLSAATGELVNFQSDDRGRAESDGTFAGTAA